MEIKRLISIRTTTAVNGQRPHLAELHQEEDCIPDQIYSLPDIRDGPGYADLSRYHTLESAAIVGHDQRITCPASPGEPHRFYRLAVWLAP